MYNPWHPGFISSELGGFSYLYSAAPHEDTGTHGETAKYPQSRLCYGTKTLSSVQASLTAAKAPVPRCFATIFGSFSHFLYLYSAAPHEDMAPREWQNKT